MQPYTIKPGETVTGVGFDFAARLADGETLSSASATGSTGLTVASATASGTEATATISVASDLADSDLLLTFTVTGTAGSVRKAVRSVLVRAAE